MSETKTLTFMSDWFQDEQEFASIIIEIVKRKYEKYEREHEELGQVRVPLANIKIELEYFINLYINYMQRIAVMREKPGQKPVLTAKEMLGELCRKREIERWSDGVYQLTKGGHLYKHLVENLQ